MKAQTTNAQSDSYKWLVLALATFTFTFVSAIPQMSLPVLFDEISAELDLSLVQVGWIWGISSVLGILVGLIGGPVGDRFGPRRTLTVACLFMGVAGAARGLSTGFAMLALTTLVTGFAQWSIPMSIHKACGIWFSKKQLGMANGVVAVGMALGFLLGALLAATVFSPKLGGWRNVFFAYGAVAILFAMFWWFSQEKAGLLGQQGSPIITFREAIGHVVRLRNVWILCIATAGGYVRRCQRDAGLSATLPAGSGLGAGSGRQHACLISRSEHVICNSYCSAFRPVGKPPRCPGGVRIIDWYRNRSHRIYQWCLDLGSGFDSRLFT